MSFSNIYYLYQTMHELLLDKFRFGGKGIADIDFLFVFIDYFRVVGRSRISLVLLIRIKGFERKAW